jgi:nucleotide-binding universal stress UspA family protein
MERQAGLGIAQPPGISDKAPEAGTSQRRILLMHAKEEGADLFVMGAFGRSRFREWIRGGATRQVLESRPSRSPWPINKRLSCFAFH